MLITELEYLSTTEQWESFLVPVQAEFIETSVLFYSMYFFNNRHRIWALFSLFSFSSFYASHGICITVSAAVSKVLR